MEKLPECFNSAQIAILTQKSPPNLIRTRKGSGGKELKYLPHNFVTEMLNQAFGFGWSFHTDVIQISDKECIVKGKVIIHNKTQDIVKEQYGSQTLMKGMAIGDALKGAGSDALRKCASLLGIGLDLYGEEHLEEEPPPITVTRRVVEPATNDPTRLITSQEIWALKSKIKVGCTELGLNQDLFEERLLGWLDKKWARKPEELVKEEYDELIRSRLPSMFKALDKEIHPERYLEPPPDARTDEERKRALEDATYNNVNAFPRD